jgi:translation initiation factor IF-3
MNNAILSFLISIAQNLLSAIAKIMDYVKSKQWMDMGKQQAEAEIAKEQTSIVREQTSVLVEDRTVEDTKKKLEDGTF